jgi:beta-N-acetylhexosaminidase
MTAGASIRSCAGQVLVAGFPGGAPPEVLLVALRRGELGGIILFRRNVETPVQVAELIGRCTAQAPRGFPLLVAVDQEGGRVTRFDAPLLQLPPMRVLGRMGDSSLTARVARMLARQLAAMGFTMNMAPVLDVDTNPDNPIIGDRAFGSTAELVITQAVAFSDGLLSGGLLSCGKHFPGHGDTAADSHLALPRVCHRPERLDAIELAPFRAAIGRIPALMTAHVVFEELDSGVPATLSRRIVTGLLREELGYDGLVISDDLEMRAVSEGRGVANAGVGAIDAGCDVLLVCSSVDDCLATHAALVRRAEEDPVFEARLRDAARRALDLRRRVPPRPSPRTLSEVLEDPEVGRIQEMMATAVET